jgi:hypothetical protein
MEDLKKSASLDELERILLKRDTFSSDMSSGVPTAGLYSKDGQLERVEFLKKKDGPRYSFFRGCKSIRKS